MLYDQVKRGFLLEGSWTPEKKTIRMTDLAHGREYLVNFYSLFGVTPEQVNANAEAAIKPAYRDLMKKYHPDKYQHLAEAFQVQTAHVTRNIQLGYDTLTTPQKRVAYDNQLADWKGPISDSGFPICDQEFLAELTRQPMTEKQIEDSEGILAQIAGYHADTHQVLERQLENGKSDPKLLRALDQSLYRKEILRGVQEQLYWQNTGARHELPETNNRAGYLDFVRNELATAHAAIPDLAQKLLLQASSGQIKLLADGNDDTAALVAEPEQGLEKITQALTARLKHFAPKIESLAAEQEAIHTERVSLLQGEYRPAQRKFHPQLALCCQVGPVTKWFFVRKVDGNRVEVDYRFSEEELQTLSDPKVAKRWIRRGVNVMFCQFILDGIEFPEQMQEIVAKHFDNHTAQQSGE